MECSSALGTVVILVYTTSCPRLRTTMIARAYVRLAQLSIDVERTMARLTVFGLVHRAQFSRLCDAIVTHTHIGFAQFALKMKCTGAEMAMVVLVQQACSTRLLHTVVTHARVDCAPRADKVVTSVARAALVIRCPSALRAQSSMLAHPTPCNTGPIAQVVSHVTRSTMVSFSALVKRSQHTIYAFTSVCAQTV